MKNTTIKSYYRNNSYDLVDFYQSGYKLSDCSKFKILASRYADQK